MNGDEPTIDHIVPQIKGGTDDLSNLQVLTREENSAKGDRPDAYWATRFFWDGDVNIGAFRTAQRERAYQRIIELREWFLLKDRSEITRRLYLLGWIVGAGKTLAIPALAFGHNHLVGADSQRPRVDRVLVLTKERAIRDQLAAELSTDLARYGICGAFPRVRILGEGDKYASDLRRDHVEPKYQLQVNLGGISYDNLNPAFLDGQVDIVVGCLQSLWQTNGSHRPGLALTLSLFPHICFDEPHFANVQVMSLVDLAVMSVCFGLTGTPIEATGKLRKSYILFSTYTYIDAITRDGSLKLLPDMLRDAFHEITIEKAIVQTGATILDSNDTRQPHYDRNIVPAISVARTTVGKLKELDAYCDCPGEFRPSIHRSGSTGGILAPSCNLVFPAHAMIVADSVETACRIKDQLNADFQSDQANYPEDQGWRAEVVHSETPGFDGSDEAGKGSGRGAGRKAQPLTPSHEWFAARKRKWLRTGGRWKTDRADWCRVLVTVGMAREGINNPFLCCVGVAKSTESMHEVIQRVIGRSLRAVVELSQDGSPVRFPPHMLDQISVVSHETFNNGPALKQGIDWLLSMGDHLNELLKVEDLISGTAGGVVSDGPLNTADTLSQRERVALATEVGKARADGRPIDTTEIVAAIIPTEQIPGEKGRRAAEWVRTVVADTPEARSRLNLRESLNVIPIVKSEAIDHTPSIDQLSAFMRYNCPPELHNLIPRLYVGEIQQLVAHMYRTYQGRLHSSPLRNDTNINDVSRSIGYQVKHRIGQTSTIADQSIFAKVQTAIRSVFGLDDGERLSNGSKYDTPQHHYMISRPDVQNDIVGWTMRQLIADGACHHLAVALRYEE